MLKALELHGFKSFADRTRLEFPPGISVIVGPNGSGKSNIVDAIKWVLGERSAKSLRGQEMSDVIFKGSGSGNRKAMNTAEATIVFDNAAGNLAIDSPEVHVTRRVYRSGEGEYLINGQACRLRDLKDVFRGTGVGSDAYSLIEQGKVDTLLAASPKDRRAIFEEAAGISRFKAKKLETQRRLLRVDQNLLRLSDIVDEVESRLRSVRSQASKARRYRELTQRLQELRTQVGLADWAQLTRRLEAIEAELDQLRQQTAAAAAEVEAVETESAQCENQLAAVGEDVLEAEHRIAQTREQIAKLESTAEHERRHLAELEQEDRRHREHLLMISSRAGDLQSQLTEAADSLAAARRQHADLAQRLDRERQQVAVLQRQVGELRSVVDAARGEYVEQMQQAATLGSQASATQSELEAGQRTLRHIETRVEQSDQSKRELADRLAELRAAEQQLDDRHREAEQASESAQREYEQTRSELADRQRRLTQLAGQLAGTRQRIEVLDELQRRAEGVLPGVKDLLEQARRQPSGPLASIHGMVADLIRVNVETAPLIDVALGERAQHLVIGDETLIEQIDGGRIRLAGRVGFQRLDATVARGDGERVRIDGEDGVIGRADRFVQTAPEFASLVRRLLGTTWLVKTLDDALRLSRSSGRGLRFATVGGDLLDADGTIQTGPRHVATSLVSRRSQLEALRGQVDGQQQQLDRTRRETADSEQQIDQQQQQIAALQRQQKEAAAALSEHRVTLNTVRQRHQQTLRELETMQAERRGAEQQQQAAQQQHDRTAAELAQLEAALATRKQELAEQERQLADRDRRRTERNSQFTALQVQSAKSEQRLDDLQQQVSQLEQHQNERTASIANARLQLSQCQLRRGQTETNILAAAAELAELYLAKEAAGDQAAQLVAQRQQLTAQRAESTQQAGRIRREMRQFEEQLHQKELVAGEVRHDRNTLVQRLREDYDIELAELDDQESDEQQHEREQVDQEIADLRRKISNIGAVNMEALAELEDLEQRFASLSGQYEDLNAAKQSLEKIISKINADSRRLFAETLKAIRENFRGLFRKVFGGGQSDIVLEEGVDMLDAGIEIVATPPGKHSLGISLLSGGERALTAVTLLLAIFQYRPSPFCVLDEVDGPLDEANIGRFLDVLNEFLAWTKFVVVTHSKKTMTAASTLYGITMQESGVSKRVSVQFDDVSEDGHINPEAIQREADQPTDDERAA